MTHSIKTLTSKRDALSSIPRTLLKVKRLEQAPQNCPLNSTHTPRTHVHTQNNLHFRQGLSRPLTPPHSALTTIDKEDIS